MLSSVCVSVVMISKLYAGAAQMRNSVGKDGHNMNS
jgi:hypothetical protein